MFPAFNPIKPGVKRNGHKHINSRGCKGILRVNWEEIHKIQMVLMIPLPIIVWFFK